MATPSYPSTYSLSTGKELWSGKPQRQEEQSGTIQNLALAGSTLIGLHKLGQAEVGSKNIYDHYVSALRGMEEYSPGHFLRTFQLGNFFSQFSSEALQERRFDFSLPGSDAKALYLRKLAKLTDSQFVRLQQDGARFSGNKLYYGSSEDVILDRASVVLNAATTEHSKPQSHFSAAYTRSIGIDDSSDQWRRAGRSGRRPEHHGRQHRPERPGYRRR